MRRGRLVSSADARGRWSEFCVDDWLALERSGAVRFWRQQIEVVDEQSVAARHAAIRLKNAAQKDV